MTDRGSVPPPARSVHAVLPGDVDDVTGSSGGNTYDRRACQGLAEVGWRVHEVAVPGEWPLPDDAARERLARSLAALPDGAVVLLDGLVSCGVPEVVVPHAGRLRMVFLVHLPLADETGLAPARAADLDAREHATLHAGCAVVVTSPWAARRVAEHHGLPAAAVHVASPGTDRSPIAPGSDGASRLVCVAAVTPAKGHDLLVDALSHVVDLPWTCACVGSLNRDPAYVARIRSGVARHGLADRIRFTGPQAGGQLASTYSTADLVVVPSRVETYGMVVAEALARGIPVIAAGAGAVPETLGRAPDGEVPGILVSPESAMELAGALRRWFVQPELRRRLGRSARRRRGTLRGWSATSRDLASVLERLRGETGRQG